jgi:hypothetical protein
VTASHLRYAIALDRALKRHHPDCVLTILLVDPHAIDPKACETLSIVSPEEIGVPYFDRLRIRYGAYDLANHLKPFLVEHVLRRVSRKVVLLDSDVLVVGRFDAAFELLDEAFLVLTPHLLDLGLVDAGAVPVRQIIDLGVYNGGLWAVRGCPESLTMLRWLQRFLSTTDLPFADQRALPLLVQLAGDGFRCLTLPSYNIAYWNIHERPVRREAGGYSVDRMPVVFFHMSGFDDARPDVFSRFWPPGRPLPEVCTAAARDFASLIPENPALRAVGYGYSRAGGRLLTPALRRHYALTGTLDGFYRGEARRLVRRIVRSIRRRISRP